MYPLARQWVSPPAGGSSVNMVKVSISLPNNTQITFESEESEVLHEIVGMVLRDLPRDLGLLFDLAGWRRPGNFTQTLRNAARSKFGWLERIPGRSGRYAATPLGLSKTLPGG